MKYRKAFMKRIFKKGLPTAVLAGIGALASQATLALEPANYSLGPVYLTPTLDTKVGYVDNLFRSDDDEKDTGISVVEPRVQAWLENGLNTYSLAYTLTDYRYFDSSDDNYTDNTVNLDIHHEFNAKNVVNVFAEYYDGHEERGTGLTEGLAGVPGIGRIIDEPVELQRTIYGGNYTFGSKAAKGRIKLGAKGTEHEYQNFDEYTQYRSRDQYDYDGTFFWKIAPRTDLLLEVRYADVEYDKTIPGPLGSLDSEEYNYFVGAAWEATAKTSGSLRVGAYDRQYDSSGRDDDDGFSWEVDVNYMVRTYSRLNLESKRYSEETNGVGDAVDTNWTTVSWMHDWSSRSSTELSLGGGQQDYTSSNRTDDIYDVNASYTFALRRWVDLGIGYRLEDRDSDLSRFDYTRNEVYLEGKLSL
jgi:hypothetical protein